MIYMYKMRRDYHPKNLSKKSFKPTAIIIYMYYKYLFFYAQKVLLFLFALYISIASNIWVLFMFPLILQKIPRK